MNSVRCSYALRGPQKRKVTGFRPKFEHVCDQLSFVYRRNLVVMETDFGFMVKAKNELVCELRSTHEPMEIIISGMDGLSRMPWQAGKPLTWYVTVVCPLVNSYIAAAARKSAKYTNLDTQYTFQSVVIETLGPFSDCAPDFCQTWVARLLFYQAMIERLGF